MSSTPAHATANHLRRYVCTSIPLRALPSPHSAPPSPRYVRSSCAAATARQPLRAHQHCSQVRIRSGAFKIYNKVSTHFSHPNELLTLRGAPCSGSLPWRHARYGGLLICAWGIVGSRERGTQGGLGEHFLTGCSKRNSRAEGWSYGARGRSFSARGRGSSVRGRGSSARGRSLNTLGTWELERWRRKSEGSKLRLFWWRGRDSRLFLVGRVVTTLIAYTHGRD